MDISAKLKWPYSQKQVTTLLFLAVLSSLHLLEFLIPKMIESDLLKVSTLFQEPNSHATRVTVLLQLVQILAQTLIQLKFQQVKHLGSYLLYFWLQQL